VRRFINPEESAIGTTFAALSSREREVLSCLSEGWSNARIAESLRISEKTVRNHTSNLFDKLGVRSRAEAIVFARDQGFHRDRE
jgi:DNA-binding NarL/FixJ family response regulator